MFYSGLGLQASLVITVRAFPEFSDVDSAFTWTLTNGSEIVDGVVSRKVDDEVFHSKMLISPVTVKDFTEYKVFVDNGIREPVIFTLELKERGIFYFIFVRYYN